jgi:hypothetical protein
MRLIFDSIAKVSTTLNFITVSEHEMRTKGDKYIEGIPAFIWKGESVLAE